MQRLWAGVVRSRWAMVILFGGVLAVYLRTLAPGALGGDAGELQFVPAILSMPHPTGTPLYILLGKVWSMLPIGPSVAWRMNLLAAVSASMAICVVYLIVSQVLGSGSRAGAGDFGGLPRAAASLSAAASLAFGLTFWEQALLADKYAFNALLVVIVLYLALRWEQTRSPVALELLALCYGLSLAHHRTMALFAPTLLGYVWWVERGALWRDRRRLLRLATLCLVPLTLYLYLPWAEARDLPPGTWHPESLKEWYDYLFDTGRTGLVYIDPADLGEMLLFYGQTLVRDFTWIGVVLGVAGAIWQFRRSASTAIFVGVNWMAQAFLAANHHVPRQWVYFIPSFLIWSLWVGEALLAIGAWVGRLVEQWRREAAAAGLVMIAVATLLWPIAPFMERYRPLREAHLGAGVLDVWRQTLKTGHMADRIGTAIAGVAADATIVCDWEQATPLWYYQQVEGLRPDVQIVYPMERLNDAAASGRPLYVARAQPGLADRWRLSCSNSLIALQRKPHFELPNGIFPLEIILTEEGTALKLLGYEYGETSFAPASVVPLTLYWQAGDEIDSDYSVSLRLMNEAGQAVFQVDNQHPVLGTYPTSRWTAREVVSDYYEMQIARDVKPGRYHWGVVLYRALPEGGWQSLKAKETGLELAIGGSFDVH